jgi:hypothetical protein
MKKVYSNYKNSLVASPSEKKSIIRSDNLLSSVAAEDVHEDPEEKTSTWGSIFGCMVCRSSPKKKSNL